MASVTNDGVNGIVKATGSANSAELQGSATGVAVEVEATGTDTNIDLGIIPKGTGGVKLGIGSTKLTKFKTTTLAVDPANQAAAGAFTVALTFPGSTFSAAAMLIPIPPPTLEANLYPLGPCVVTAADAARLGLYALAAVDGASLTWTFLIIEP